LEDIRLPKYYQFIEADVDNLYPSINIDDALEAMSSFLNDRSLFPRAQINFLIKLIRWVLKNNYIMFGNQTYLQIRGTAMGTPCAVVVACIYMHILEQEALNQFCYQRSMIRCIYLFIRFIDDYIILISDHTMGLKLMELLNSRRKSIKLTFQIRNMEAQFLDLTLYKPHHHLDKIAVRAYSKPMNKYLFLPPSSCHPTHVFSGWILGYGRRLRLNCSNDNDYFNNLTDFKSRLLQRGYNEQMITETFANIPNRHTILQSITTPTSTSSDVDVGTPFVVMYTPAIKTLLPAIKQAIAITEEVKLDPHYPLIFSASTTPLLSFKRGSNLRDLVASSSLS